MILRRLTPQGLSAFEEFIAAASTDTPQDHPGEHLGDDDLSEALPQDVEMELATFESRLQLGRYLYDALHNSTIDGLLQDRGTWAWIAWHYFDEICPRKGNGDFNPGERARWIPDISNHRKYYRHLIAGPYRVYRAHSDDPARTRCVLSNPPGSPGEIAEQISAYQELVTNKAVMGAATLLYIDPVSNLPKRGSGSKGPGSPRRFVKVLYQYDVTYDLYSMERDELLDILPSEFDRFRNSGP